MARKQNKSTVELRLEFNKNKMIFPVNPEEIAISKSSDNTDIDIVGIGKAVRYDYPSLVTVHISSFFPEKGGDFNKEDSSYRSPKGCVEFINNMWKTENKNNNVGKFVTTGLPKNVSFYCVVNSFSWGYKAGQEKDIYYELELKEYKPYTIKRVKVNNTGLKAQRANTNKK